MFSNNEKKEFDRPDIIEAYKNVGEYRFWVELPTAGSVQVKIRIDQDLNGYFYFDLSHYMQTPQQAAPYVTSRNRADTLEQALGDGLNSLFCFYDQAVSRGENPSPSWFVASKD
jgi:hypothetical protein